MLKNLFKVLTLTLVWLSFVQKTNAQNDVRLMRYPDINKKPDCFCVCRRYLDG